MSDQEENFKGKQIKNAGRIQQQRRPVTKKTNVGLKKNIYISSKMEEDDLKIMRRREL